MLDDMLIHPPLLQTDRESGTQVSVRVPMPLDSAGAPPNYDSSPGDRAWLSECTISCTVSMYEGSCFLKDLVLLVKAGIVWGPLSVLRTASAQQDGIVTDRRISLKLKEGKKLEPKRLSVLGHQDMPGLVDLRQHREAGEGATPAHPTGVWSTAGFAPEPTSIHLHWGPLLHKMRRFCRSIVWKTYQLRFPEQLPCYLALTYWKFQ
jgi:hypothetical protein